MTLVKIFRCVLTQQTGMAPLIQAYKIGKLYFNIKISYTFKLWFYMDAKILYSLNESMFTAENYMHKHTHICLIYVILYML